MGNWRLFFNFDQLINVIDMIGRNKFANICPSFERT